MQRIHAFPVPAPPWNVEVDCDDGRADINPEAGDLLMGCTYGDAGAYTNYGSVSLFAGG